jgi:hypothetical protein
MSGINGDKSRSHRMRKQKLARRVRNRAMLKALAKKESALAPSTSDAKRVFK